MRTVTAIAAGVLLVGLSGAAFVAYDAGGGDDGRLSELWITDTARDTTGNHHRAAVAQVDDEPVVFAPINSPVEANDCDLAAIDRNGTVIRRTAMASDSCNIHGYGTPTTADIDADGTDEVLVATTAEAVLGYDARTGETVLRHNLTWWGYTAPVVADFTESPGREMIVADLAGDALVLSANGSRLWNVTLSTTVAEPHVADYDADGRDEVAVGHVDGVTLLGSDGTADWETPIEGNVNWMTTGDANGDGEVPIVVATGDGEVVALDGRDGSIDWRRTVGEYAAVEAFGDGDGDGRAEVYAVARDGTLHAIDASDGTVEWSTTLTTEDVPMMPPPALGDLDGDGDQELVAGSMPGVASVVDPRSGAVIDEYERGVPIRSAPRLADIDGVAGQEILVVYGDGRVTALSFE